MRSGRPVSKRHRLSTGGSRVGSYRNRPQPSRDSVSPEGHIAAVVYKGLVSKRYRFDGLAGGPLTAQHPRSVADGDIVVSPLDIGVRPNGE